MSIQIYVHSVYTNTCTQCRLLKTFYQALRHMYIGIFASEICDNHGYKSLNSVVWHAIGSALHLYQLCVVLRYVSVYVYAFW